MNLQCNCINNRCMLPRLYVQVNNYVHGCVIFFTIKYFFRGKWITKTSNIIGLDEHTRLHYEKTSIDREFTIYKHLVNRDVFIYNTIIMKSVPVCYEVTGTSEHTVITEVQC